MLCHEPTQRDAERWIDYPPEGGSPTNLPRAPSYKTSTQSSSLESLSPTSPTVPQIQIKPINVHPMAPTALFSPLVLGDHTLKNRITMSALTRNRAVETYPTDLMMEYYVQRASAGLIVTEGVLVTRQGCGVAFL